MSRLRIIGLLAALAAIATVIVACGSGEDPGKVLDGASWEGMKSGNLDFSLSVKSGGREGGNIDVRVSGPFQRRGKDLPHVDLTATVKGTANGEAIDFEGGLILLSNRGFVNYEGVEYEIDPSNFSFAKTSFLPLDPTRRREAGVSALSSCQEAAASLDLAEFADNLSNDGSADVDGASTTKVSGDLDVSAAFDALVELAENPSCDAQLEAAGRSAGELKKVESELTGAVETAHVEIYVGDDGIIRKLAGELTAEPKGSGRDGVVADFELTLSEVNEDPKIKIPAKASSILAWLQKIGIEPFSAAFLISEAEGLGHLLEIAAADAFPSGLG